MLGLTPFLALRLIKLSLTVLESISWFTPGGDFQPFQDSGMVMEPLVSLFLFGSPDFSSSFHYGINSQLLLKRPFHFHRNNYEFVIVYNYMLGLFPKVL